MEDENIYMLDGATVRRLAGDHRRLKHQPTNARAAPARHCPAADNCAESFAAKITEEVTAMTVTGGVCTLGKGKCKIHRVGSDGKLADAFEVRELFSIYQSVIDVDEFCLVRVDRFGAWLTDGPLTRLATMAKGKLNGVLDSEDATASVDGLEAISGHPYTRLPEGEAVAGVVNHHDMAGDDNADCEIFRIGETWYLLQLTCPAEEPEEE